MRSEHESDDSARLLDAEPRPGDHGSWPLEWAGGGSADDERALRELREGMLRGRIRDGARWEVPARAAIAVAVVAFVVVAAVVVLLLRSGTEDAGVAVGETAPLVSTPEVTAPVASPDVTEASAQFQVHVVGQVRSPGVVSLPMDARVQDAIDAAGGASGKADLTQINLARKIVDGERILVPKPGQKIQEEAPAEAGTGSAPAAGSPVDLNTASVGQLDALPGVGPVLAARIIEWRQANGKFTTVDDLNEVSGIGDATMEKLRPLVRV